MLLHFLFVIFTDGPRSGHLPNLGARTGEGVSEGLPGRKRTKRISEEATRRILKEQ